MRIIGLMGLALLLGSSMYAQKITVQGNRIEVDGRLDAHPNQHAVDLLNHYKKKVDDIMSPVIGESAHAMSARAPESDLSNLVADALRLQGSVYMGEQIDVAVLNFGGLRSSLPAGEITFGHVFEITPFENSLIVFHVKGHQVRALFENMCRIKNGCLSGAQLIAAQGRLKSALVGGKPIVDEADYVVATLDYVAEGNDGFTEFTTWTGGVAPEGATMRQLFLDYVEALTHEGKKVDAQIEGRFKIEN